MGKIPIFFDTEGASGHTRFKASIRRLVTSMKSLPLAIAAALCFGPCLRAVAQDSPAAPDKENAGPGVKVALPDEEAETAPGASARPGAGGLPEIDVSISTPEAKKAQEEFLKLPQDKKDKFGALMQEGQSLLGQKRVQEALTKLNEAEVLWPLHPNIINLKGAALVNIKDYERAHQYFEKGTALYPNFWQLRFNLAEMKFVSKDYKKAEAIFQELLDRVKQLQGTTRTLVEYKVILCVIKEGRSDEARKMIDKYDIYGDTPIYYFGLAAWYFEKGDKAKGQEWVKNANKVYGPEVSGIFGDALIELGWIQSY